MTKKSLLLVVALCGLCVSHAFAARSWVEVPGAVLTRPNEIFAVAAVSDTDVWAVGESYGSGYKTLTQHWDGTGWTVVPSPNPSGKINFLRAASALSSSNVWAAGHAVRGDTEQTLVEYWNGTKWFAVPSPNVGEGLLNSLWGISAISRDDVWAVGQSGSDSSGEPLVLHGDGDAMTIASTPAVPGGVLYAVHGIAADDVWAVGVVGASTLTMHWDGAAWSVVPSPNVSPTANRLTGVAMVASDDVWAVGFSGVVSVSGKTLAMHWDGTDWTVVPTPSLGSDSEFNFVVAVSPSAIWAVGKSGGNALTARGNLTEWHLVPPPRLDPFADLLSISVTKTGTLWAAGTQSINYDQLFLMMTR